MVHALGINPRLLAGYLHTYYCWAKKISPAHCIWISILLKRESEQLSTGLSYISCHRLLLLSLSLLVNYRQSSLVQSHHLRCSTLALLVCRISRFSSPAWLQRAVAAVEGHQHAYVGENSSHALSQGTPPLSDGVCDAAVWGAKTSSG